VTWTAFFAGAALVLLALVSLALVRVLRGPDALDRMMGVQLFGTAGTGVLLLLGEALALPGLRDAALVLALLAAVSTITFTQSGPAEPEEGRDEPA